jgi:hypothetical protein
VSTKTVLYPPTKETTQKWLFSVQNLHPLVTADTSAGSYSEALPPAGGLSGTGQNNLNQEITYRKISADGNTFTVTGSPDGPQVLTTNTGAGSAVKFKSDGTDWWVVQWP